MSIIEYNSKQNKNKFRRKSKLFFEFVKVLSDIKPKYFLFENVASMNKESQAIISDHLGCNPILIDSKDFSAQNRPRFYWTNIPINLTNVKTNISLKDILEKNVMDKYFIKCDFTWLGYSKTVCAILNIKGHDIIKRVNNPFHKCQTLTTCSGGNTQKKVFDLQKKKPRKLTPLEYERLQTLPDNYTMGLSDTRRYSIIGNCWTIDVIAHIFNGLNQ